MMKTTKVLAVALVSTALVFGCGDKDSSSKGKTKDTTKSAALKMVKTDLPGLKLTMQAPEGATVTGKGMTFVRKGNGFSIQLQKDVYGVTGDKLIIPFEKKLMIKKLVDEPNLQIWTKKMIDKPVVLFAMKVKVGETKYYVQSGGMGMFTRAQVDTMIKAARTLAEKK